MSYRTVNYLAYRVSVATSAAKSYASETQAVAAEAASLDIRGGPDYYTRIVPEIKAQAARAEAAAAKADFAGKRCFEAAHEDPQGPVIRVSDRLSFLWDEDENVRKIVSDCSAEANSGRGEAHLALEIAQALLGMARQHCSIGGEVKRHAAPDS